MALARVGAFQETTDVEAFCIELVHRALLAEAGAATEPSRYVACHLLRPGRDLERNAVQYAACRDALPRFRLESSPIVCSCSFPGMLESRPSASVLAKILPRPKQSQRPHGQPFASYRQCSGRSEPPTARPARVGQFAIIGKSFILALCVVFLGRFRTSSLATGGKRERSSVMCAAC
jgi:hypothetical protein